jgi:hypothetical protein
MPCVCVCVCVYIYIYGAPCKGRNFNDVYIYIYNDIYMYIYGPTFGNVTVATAHSG